MTIKNGDMPAIPIEVSGFGAYQTTAFTGLTKREQFAMAAMQGLLSMYGYGDYASEKLSEYAVEHADSLLAALEREQGDESIRV